MLSFTLTCKKLHKHKNYTGFLTLEATHAAEALIGFSVTWGENGALHLLFCNIKGKIN